MTTTNENRPSAMRLTGGEHNEAEEVTNDG